MHDHVPVSAPSARSTDIDWGFWRTVTVLLVVILVLWARDAHSQPWERIGPDLHSSDPVTHPLDEGVAFINAYGRMYCTVDDGDSW